MQGVRDLFAFAFEVLRGHVLVHCAESSAFGQQVHEGSPTQELPPLSRDLRSPTHLRVDYR